MWRDGYASSSWCAAYSVHVNCMARVPIDSTLENIRAASAHLLQGVPPDEVINVTVTCDGTWSKRGFTAMYGVVVVIAWETGQMLDFQIKSKRCMACALKLNSVDEDSEEFRMWWDGLRDMWEESCGLISSDGGICST